MKKYVFGFLCLFILSNGFFIGNGLVEDINNSPESILTSSQDRILEKRSENIQDEVDIKLKTYSESSNHYVSEPITLFLDENILIPDSSGSISKVDFFDRTDPSRPIFLGSSKLNEINKRWELKVNFNNAGLKAITAEIITSEGYTTQTTSLVQINDELNGASGGYYSAIFGSDTIAELGWEGNSGHFEDRKREEFFGVDAEIEVDVQLHEITKAYYDSSTSKWYATKESTVKLTAEANRIHGIIYHESPGNAFMFQISDLDVGDYVNFGGAAYRWFGDPSDDYVYMYNKVPTFDGSYCIGMKIDVDLDLSAWTDDGHSWSNGGNDYRMVHFAFTAKAADLTVVATALANNYFLIVYDRDAPTMNGPIINDIYYFTGGLRVTNPEFLKYNVMFRADFTPIEGLPSTGSHEYRWRIDSDTWSAWTPTSYTYCYSPYLSKGSSGGAMIMVEIRDTYYWNTRDYGEIFYWDYSGSYSNVNYDNLVKSSSVALDDIASGTLSLAQDYANPTDYSGCGVDRDEDIWKYKDIYNNWQTIGMGDGAIVWNVNGLPDADPGYQLSYYTEDRLGNGRENSNIWVKTNNKGPVLYEEATFFSSAYKVDDTTYVHESTDWTVTAYDNVGINERDDGIASMYVRIWTDLSWPLEDVIHYEGTVTGFTYVYTLEGHKVYTLRLDNLFDLPTLQIHDTMFFLDYRLFDNLGKESELKRYGVKLSIDHKAEHHGAEIVLSNISPTYLDQSTTYISGITRLSVTGQDPDIRTYEWFVDSTSVASTSTSYYDLDTDTLVNGQSYSFKVKVTDIFGNTFTTAETQLYTVDNIIPSVGITSLTDNEMLKGVISLEWSTESADIVDAYWQYRFWENEIWTEWETISDSDGDYSNALPWDTTLLPESI